MKKGLRFPSPTESCSGETKIKVKIPNAKIQMSNDEQKIQNTYLTEADEWQIDF
jgi:hypothetical protein